MLRHIHFVSLLVYDFLGSKLRDDEIVPRGEIEFRNVYVDRSPFVPFPPTQWLFLKVAVAYDAHGENIISNFDFKIAPTEKIAIVGRTGAGKVSSFPPSLLCFLFFSLYCRLL